MRPDEEKGVIRRQRQHPSLVLTLFSNRMFKHLCLDPLSPWVKWVWQWHLKCLGVKVCERCCILLTVRLQLDFKWGLNCFFGKQQGGTIKGTDSMLFLTFITGYVEWVKQSAAVHHNSEARTVKTQPVQQSHHQVSVWPSRSLIQAFNLTSLALALSFQTNKQQKRLQTSSSAWTRRFTKADVWETSKSSGDAFH